MLRRFLRLALIGLTATALAAPARSDAPVLANINTPNEWEEFQENSK